VALSNLPGFIRKNYAVHEWRHASAVLRTDFRQEWDDIVAVLSAFRLLKSHISVGGGGKSKVSGSIDSEFTKRGWRERKFETQIRVDESVIDSPTHKVDCCKKEMGPVDQSTEKRSIGSPITNRTYDFDVDLVMRWK
jgi:hypothetical protein